MTGNQTLLQVTQALKNLNNFNFAFLKLYMFCIKPVKSPNLCILEYFFIKLRFLLIVYIFFLDLSNLIRGRPCKGVKNLIKLKTICLCHHYTWGEQHFRKNIGILKTIRIAMEVTFGFFVTCSRKRKKANFHENEHCRLNSSDHTNKSSFTTSLGKNLPAQYKISH